MVLLFVPCVALASPRACGLVQTSVDRERAYANVVAAVDAMRREHLNRSVRSDREFVGAVVENASGRYWASVGNGCFGQNTVTFAVQIPPNAQVAAFWHTHGAAAPSRDLFSPEDIDLVRNTGLDFYLITARGEIKVLRPSDVVRIGSVRVGRIRQRGAAMRSRRNGRAMPPKSAWRRWSPVLPDRVEG